jgi:aconitate hydratase
LHVVGYGCTTCIGNSGPLPERCRKGIAENDLVCAFGAVGQPQLRGRIHPRSRMNYLASPPLVVAYAIAGTVDIDLMTSRSAGQATAAGVPARHLAGSEEIGDHRRDLSDPRLFAQQLRRRVQGRARVERDRVARRPPLRLGPKSTYIKKPPFFDGMTMQRRRRSPTSIGRARAGPVRRLDHHRPHLARPATSRSSPAGRYLQDAACKGRLQQLRRAPRQHDVMVRGTFANIRIKNLMFGRRGRRQHAVSSSGEPEMVRSTTRR